MADIETEVRAFIATVTPAKRLLEAIVAESYRTLTRGTYTLRARDGRPAQPDAS